MGKVKKTRSKVVLLCVQNGGGDSQFNINLFCAWKLWSPCHDILCGGKAMKLYDPVIRSWILQQCCAEQHPWYIQRACT